MILLINGYQKIFHSHDIPLAQSFKCQNCIFIQVILWSDETAFPKPLPIRSSFSNLRPSSPLAGQKTPESTTLRFSDGRTQSTPILIYYNQLRIDYFLAPYFKGQFLNLPFIRFVYSVMSSAGITEQTNLSLPLLGCYVHYMKWVNFRTVL